MKPASRAMQRMACSLLPVLLYTACGGEGSGGVGPKPAFTGVRAVLGAGVSDTIGALLKQALVVEVRDADGHVVPGVVVRFEVQQIVSPTSGFGYVPMGICALTASYCGSSFVADTTDSQGRANALVHLGTTAGTAVVQLKVPELGLVDSASYTITPGAPAHVRAATADTAVDIGGSVTLSGQVTDRVGNPRSEVPTMSLATGSSVTLDATKGTVTGTAMGTQWVYAKYASFADSTSVRVIPPGRLVVWAASPREVRLVNTNGSSVVALMNNVSSDYGVFPHFDATRQRVTMHSGTQIYGGPPTNIVVLDTGTFARQDFGAALGFTLIVAERRISDGSVLAVAQRTSVAGFSLWKIATDGTVTAVASLPSMVSLYDGADISRDGTRVAYLAPAAGGGLELRVLDVASGAYTVLATNVLSPRFSPQGDRVAFLVSGTGYASSDGTMSVIDVNGVNRKSLGDFVFSPGLAWSPDGTYLLGRNSAFGGVALRMLRVSDGANVLLRFRSANGNVDDYYQPDWR